MWTGWTRKLGVGQPLLTVVVDLLVQLLVPCQRVVELHLALLQTVLQLDAQLLHRVPVHRRVADLALPLPLRFRIMPHVAQLPVQLQPAHPLHLDLAREQVPLHLQRHEGVGLPQHLRQLPDLRVRRARPLQPVLHAMVHDTIRVHPAAVPDPPFLRRRAAPVGPHIVVRARHARRAAGEHDAVRRVLVHRALLSCHARRCGRGPRPRRPHRDPGRRRLVHADDPRPCRAGHVH